jgi:tight adherence protein C
MPAPALPLGVTVAVLALSLVPPIVLWAAIVRGDGSRERVLDNLRRGLVRPDSASVPAPPSSVLAALGRTLARPQTVRRFDLLLAKAGRPAAWPLQRVLAAKLVLPVAAAGLGALVLVNHASTLIMLTMAAVTVISFFVPDLLLRSRGQERSATIQLELADTLDQMTIAVEAGLGFDSAMARAGRNGKGPLAEELLRTLQDVQMGRSRREAFEGLAARSDTADLRRFIRAVLQADAYGVSVADVLRTQAAEMRMKRRQRAEEKAMQVPVKVIFPLMFCILPVLFIVLLGPAVMNIVKAFG